MIRVPYTAESDCCSFHWRERERERTGERERARTSVRERVRKKEREEGIEEEGEGGRERDMEAGRGRKKDPCSAFGRWRSTLSLWWKERKEK